MCCLKLHQALDIQHKWEIFLSLQSLPIENRNGGYGSRDEPSRMDVGVYDGQWGEYMHTIEGMFVLVHCCVRLVFSFVDCYTYKKCRRYNSGRLTPCHSSSIS